MSDTSETKAVEHTIDRAVRVPMRDGRQLLADVYRPANGVQFPVLLEQTPYGPQSSEVQIEAGEFFARHGYAVVIENVAGRFGSSGVFRPFEHDRSDGADTLAWIANQSWANGRIGTIGGSYSGFTQHAVATSQNPRLACQYMRQSPIAPNRHVVYRGGAFELGFCMSWALENSVLHERSHPAEAAFSEIESWFWKLPLTPFSPLGGMSFYDRWLQTPPEHPYWEAMTEPPDIRHNQAPVFHLGGWYDPFLEGTLETYARIAEECDNQSVVDNQRLMIGPWAHGSDQTRVTSLGDRSFGEAAGLDPLAMRLDWLDGWMKDDAASLERIPPVQLFSMGINKWQDHDAWPPPGSREESFFFSGARSGTSKSLNDGSLRRQVPDEESACSSYLYDPASPVITAGGATVHILKPGPRDQRQTESTCLTFTSDSLNQELKVAGPVTCTIFAHSTGVDTDWVARLSDVDPNGHSILICEGIIRARYREGLESPRLLSDSINQFRVDLSPTANVFRKGHRIRLTITSSCFPRWDRNLNTGQGSDSTATRGLSVRNTVFHDVAHPSSLQLTVHR